MQCFGHAVFKEVLQAVNAPGGLLAQTSGHVTQVFGCFVQALLGLRLAFALKGQSIVDQGFDGFGALFLCFGHGTQASEPDVLSRVVALGGVIAGGGFGCVAGGSGHVGAPVSCHFNLSSCHRGVI